MGISHKSTRMLITYIGLYFILSTAYLIEGSSNKKEGKILPLFQVISFPNDLCSGTSKNGTCYTAEECSSAGGTTDGTCANGYGVCCIFSIGCGGSSSQNCTYFESSGTPSAGQCSAEVCQCNNNICQMRLDFSSFVITGPSTATTTGAAAVATSVVYCLNGEETAGTALGTSCNYATRCLTDSFSVTPSQDWSPTICGTNTGEHMYIESDEDCTSLDFQFSDNAIDTTLATRSWSIKVTQIACDSQARAPDGCTQYFTGSTSNTVNSYNYQSGSGYQLASQQQNVCVRRERGYCRICWSETAQGDLAVSGTVVNMGYLVKKTKTNTKACCGYGATGKGVNYDCVKIPGAVKTGGTCVAAATHCNSGFCGNALATTTGTTRKTICSTQTPFRLNYVTDAYEVGAEAGTVVTDYGFKLAYILTSC